VCMCVCLCTFCGSRVACDFELSCACSRRDIEPSLWCNSLTRFCLNSSFAWVQVHVCPPMSVHVRALLRAFASAACVFERSRLSVAQMFNHTFGATVWHGVLEQLVCKRACACMSASVGARVGTCVFVCHGYIWARQRVRAHTRKQTIKQKQTNKTTKKQTHTQTHTHTHTRTHACTRTRSRPRALANPSSTRALMRAQTHTDTHTHAHS